MEQPAKKQSSLFVSLLIVLIAAIALIFALRWSKYDNPGASEGPRSQQIRLEEGQRPPLSPSDDLDAIEKDLESTTFEL